MALTTYTNFNITNDPVGMTAVDSGIFGAVGDRAATFTPQAGYVAPTTVGQTNFGANGNDWSMGTTPAVRPKCFEPPTQLTTIDPGLIVSG